MPLPSPVFRNRFYTNAPTVSKVQSFRKASIPYLAKTLQPLMVSSIILALVPIQFSQLQACLSEKLCEIINSDMHVAAPSGLITYTYPDVTVYCCGSELTDLNQLYMECSVSLYKTVLTQNHTTSLSRSLTYQFYPY